MIGNCRVREQDAKAQTCHGRVVAVSTDRGHNFSKRSQNEIMLVAGHGIEGDVHAGAFVRHRYLARRQPLLANLRQVHLLPLELLEFLKAVGHDVAPGQLGENITTDGLELERFPLGTILHLGPVAAVELTGLRTPCVLIDRFQARLKRRLVSSEKDGPPFRCGELSVVKSGGLVTASDAIHAELPPGPPHALPPL